jgi:hypothetical protein
MSKKNFSQGLDSLLGGDPKGDKKKPGRPRDPNKRTPEKSSQEGTKNDETRATFIVNEETLDKLKAIAYWDRTLIKEVVNTALQDAISKYEKKNGDIKPIPKK